MQRYNNSVAIKSVNYKQKGRPIKNDLTLLNAISKLSKCLIENFA